MYYYGVTALLAELSACLITNNAVAGSIPGTSIILKVDQVWNAVNLVRITR